MLPQDRQDDEFSLGLHLIEDAQLWRKKLILKILENLLNQMNINSYIPSKL